MFRGIWNWIKKYAGLIDDFCVDFLTDIKSLRYQLIIWAFAYNFYLVHKAPEAIKWGVALLTAVYAFYFYSKEKQHSRVHEADQDPLTERDPDLIDE